MNKFCTHCGASYDTLTPGASEVLCPTCADLARSILASKPVEAPAVAATPVTNSSNIVYTILASIGLVCGIVAWFFLGIVFGPIGAILGGVSMKHTKLGIASFILGLISSIVMIIYFIMFW